MIKDFNKDKPLLEEFGKYIIEQINISISKKLPYLNLEYFFKVTPSYRLKEDKSLIDKAFFRNKSYKDPYADINDKLGIRLIVLTMDDVKLIEDAVKSIPNVEMSKDRDSLVERLERPDIFTYQSDHYILRPTKIFNIKGKSLNVNLSCELQARTLLQHAYAEVSHTTTYKPRLSATQENSNKTLRSLAKTSALVEITDDEFNFIMTDFQERTILSNMVLKEIHEIYSKKISKTGPISKSDELIVESFYHLLNEDTSKKINLFYSESKNSFIIDKIKDRNKTNPIYRNPSILFLYYIAKTIPPEEIIDIYPLNIETISELMNDLGLSIDQYIEH
jgi:ppGpp synthetase/RelA/SpoT-type nucleotidyltranferase